MGGIGCVPPGICYSYGGEDISALGAVGRIYRLLERW